MTAQSAADTMDILFVLASILFFAVALGYVIACARLGAGQ
jgi:hypothetical protein